MRSAADIPVSPRRDPWVALEAGADPRQRARQLRQIHEHVVSGGQPPATLRPTIMASWRRSAARGALPDGAGAPHVLDDAALAERRRTHPLAATLPAIRKVLHSGMNEAHQIMVVSDENGVLLWVEGPPREISRAADDMNFLPGSDWSEAGVGTNSIGTSLAADHAIQVFSAEHFNAACHRWTCSGAPVHDPATGRIIGAIDVTSNLAVYHPNGHPLVQAAAQVAESVLADITRRRDQRLVNHYLDQLGHALRPPSAIAAADGRVLACFPSGWVGARLGPLPPDGGPLVRLGVVAQPVLGGLGHVIRPSGAVDGPGSVQSAPSLPVLELRALGRRAATCRVHGRSLELSRRHSELLILLALHPDGLSGQQIAEALYGDRSAAVTVRAEISRLRGLVGDIIDSRPYRIAATIEADFLVVDRARGSGRASTVVDGPPGPLLLGSRVPEIMTLRARIQREVGAMHGAEG